MEEHLSKIQISEIKDLIIKDPTIIYEDTKIKEIMSAIIKDIRSRHAYVVNDSGKLIGSIRTNSVIQYLFPTIFLEENQSLQISSYLEFSNAKIAKDIMNRNPHYVYKHTKVKKLIKIMISEKINEVPVVDENIKLIGEVNIMEIIAKWLELNK